MATDRQVSPGFYDVSDRNIIVMFMEGMTNAIVNEDVIYNDLANIREMQSLTDVIATTVGGALYGIHGQIEKARTYEPGTGWRIRMYPNIYKNAFEVPDTVLEWAAQRRFVDQQVQSLGAFGIITLDYVFIAMINNGFDPAFPVYDGEPLFSQSHVLKNAPGVFANRPAVGSTINQDSLAEAYRYFMSMPNDDGVKFGMRPAILLVPVALAMKASQVLGQTLDPAVSNNGTPALATGFKQFGIPRIVVSSKLTSATAWFLLAAPSTLAGNGHGLDLWFTPDGYPQTETISKRDPNVRKYVGAFRVANVVTKVRGMWGNPGAVA